MTISPGTRLSHYEIISPIGSGGMGEVFLAEDTKLNRKIALKILPAEFNADRERMRRFVQEAQAAAALNHPHIAHVYEIGQVEDLHFIAMEFVDGTTLRERIHRDSADLKRTLKYLTQVAEGLAKAHAAGIIHRDLKPENIMISGDGYAKILDFGLAKLVAPREFQALPDREQTEAATAILEQHSKPGMILGTVGYMSPEQAQGKTQLIDNRSDIFSFGCILFEAMTGQKAFEGKDALDSLHKIVHAPTPQISEINPNAPAELQKIVRRCLAKDPEKRYQSIKDVAIELDELRQDLTEADITHTGGSPSAAATATGALTMSTDSAIRPASGAAHTDATRTTSSAEYLVSQIKQHKRGAVLVLILVAIVVAGVAFSIHKLSGNRKTSISFESAKFSRLTNSGRVTQNAISPDGKWHVYATYDGDQQSLWLQQVAVANSNTQIVAPAAVEYWGLAFSPDGNYVYYSVAEMGANTATLYQVPVLGGTARKLFTGIFGKVSFSPDGKQIAYFYYEGDEDRLMIANADGSDRRQLAGRRGNEFMFNGNHGPAWSPDGKTILTTMSTLTPLSMKVATVSVQTGEITYFCSHKFAFLAYVTWLPDGEGVVTLASETAAPPKIWQISYPSGEAQKISNDLISYFTLSMTADSKVMAAVQGDGSGDIWIAPINDSAHAAQVISGSDRNFAPSWTPDGRVVFVKNSGGNNDLYIVDPRGGSPIQLTSDSGTNSYPSVSPDGRFIVFSSDRTGAYSIWRIDIDGSNPKQLTNTNDYNPTVSPDGREVTFASNPNRSTVSKVGIDGGQPVQLTDKDSNSPVFSPDGKQIVCLYVDDPKSASKIAILPSSGGSPIKSFSLPSGFAGKVLWMPDGRSLVYGIKKNRVTNLWAQPTDGSAPRQITNFTSGNMSTFDLSRDGKQIVFSRETGSRDVVLISGFRK